MVTRPHHNTLAKAARYSFVIEGEHADPVYTIKVESPRGKVIKVQGTKANEVLEDAICLRMLLREHPGLKPRLVNGSWTITFQDQDYSAARLNDAFLDATSEVDEDELAEIAAEAEDELEGAEEGDDEEGEGEGEGGKSVVKKKYKTEYKPHKMTCGDDFASKVTSYITVPHKGKKTRVDPVKLRKLAEANGVWEDRYCSLNPGMQRMNVGNRLRNKFNKKQEIVWP